MKKVKKFILTKDFIIGTLFSCLLSFILFFSRETYKFQKLMFLNSINDNKQISLNTKDIGDNKEDIDFLKNLTFRVKRWALK